MPEVYNVRRGALEATDKNLTKKEMAKRILAQLIKNGHVGKQIRPNHVILQVIQQVIKQLRKINVRVTDKPKITVQNIVASGSVNLKLNLNTLALELENTEYEPEQFPGLVYKLVEPTATFLLFSNGKLVCTGTKNKQQLEDSMKQLNKNVRAALKRIKGL